MPPVVHTRDYVVLTEEHLREVVRYFLTQAAFAFDVESMGPDRGVPTQNDVIWLSMATRGMAVVIPFGHPNGNTLIRKATRRKNKATNKFEPIPAVFSAPPRQLRRSKVFEILRPLFMDEEIVKIAHNATFDLISVAKYLGEVPRGPKHDTIVMQHLLNENLMSKGLKDLIERYWKVKYDFENVGKCVEAHTFGKVAHYAFMDARYTWLLWNRLLPLIEKDRLEEVFELELNDGQTGVLDVLCAMNRAGAPVDEKALQVLQVDLSQRMVEIEGDIYRAAGEKFNINSTPQKQKILFGSREEGGQGLKPIKRTDGGAPSTDADTLEHYAPKNVLCQHLLDYAEINKLLGTYVLGYLGEEGNPKKPCRIYDGRIHADLVQYGTVTGRFSCREPNLQNIPRPSTDLGKKIRGLFIAPQGFKMVVADYGQIEMMLLAHFAGPGPLFHGIHNGMDPHSATAAALASIDPDEFMAMVRAEDKKAKNSRQVAKGINFACVPMSSQALTKQGWKTYDELFVGDLVLGHDGKNLVWTPVREKVRYESAPVVRMSNSTWVSYSTPNHRWDTVRRTGRGHTRRSVREWSTTETLTSEHQITLSAPLLEEDSLLSPTEAAVLAWLHTDGHIERSEFVGAPSQGKGGCRTGFHGSIFQHDKKFCDEIETLLHEVPHRRYYRRGTGINEWRIDPQYLRDLWAKAGLDYTSLEQVVLRLGTEALESFVNACWMAEGWKDSRGARLMRQNEGPVLEAMHTASFLLGYDVTRTGVSLAGNKPDWTLRLRRPHVTMQRVTREMVADQPVWCIVTDHQNWVMRQGSRIMLTGNTVYGAGPDKVASMAEISVQEAKHFLSIHQEQFPEVYRLKRKIIETAKSRRPPHIVTLLGRKRRLPALMYSDKGLRGAAERQAVNSLIQGSAADIIKLAMIRLHETLPPEMQLILSVHDELVTLTPEDRAEECAGLVHEAMLGEGIQRLVNVPLDSDLKIVDRWSDAK